MMFRKRTLAIPIAATLTLTGCGGNDKDSTPETTSTTSTTMESSARPSATVLIDRANPGMVTSFESFMSVLDKKGIGYSNAEDTTDDPTITDAGSGNVDVDGLGTVWFFLAGNPSGALTTRLNTATVGKPSYFIMGKNFGVDAYGTDDDAASELASTFGASLYAIR